MRGIVRPSRTSRPEYRSPGANANQTDPTTMAHTLPDLGYAFNALEPHIDARTMEIHHDKHHAAYVTNLNNAIAGKGAIESKSAEELITDLGAVPDDIRTPSSYRNLRTESEDLPATASTVEPAQAVGQGVSSAPPVTVDETPLSSRAPAEIPAGESSAPGSPDSVDMIMDWEDDQDASEPEPDFASDPATEALYDRLLADVFGPDIATNPLHPAAGIHEALDGNKEALAALGAALPTDQEVDAMFGMSATCGWTDAAGFHLESATKLAPAK